MCSQFHFITKFRAWNIFSIFVILIQFSIYLMNYHDLWMTVYQYIQYYERYKIIQKLILGHVLKWMRSRISFHHVQQENPKNKIVFSHWLDSLTTSFFLFYVFWGPHERTEATGLCLPKVWMVYIVSDWLATIVNFVEVHSLNCNFIGKVIFKFLIYCITQFILWLKIFRYKLNTKGL